MGYSPQFFVDRQAGAQSSAAVVIPLLLNVLQPAPRSVIDIGCGIGTWLRAFRDLGGCDCWGVDGQYIDKSLLEIPPERFIESDLRRPFRMDRRFDLAVCLEVAEHLPPEVAGDFVAGLSRLSPVILFSAAIPHQGGTDHINEQWPEYWAGHFRDNGYAAVDCLRPAIWGDERVEWWYAQNLLLFVSSVYLDDNTVLKKESEAASGRFPLSLVHPRAYLSRVEHHRDQAAWLRQLHAVSRDVMSVVAEGSTLILVDDNQLDAAQMAPGCRVLPFLERGGCYWGLPPDDQTAIDELERVRKAGASFIAFASPAFWWLAHYGGFSAYLRSKYQVVLDNDRVVVFHLKGRDHA